MNRRTLIKSIALLPAALLAWASKSTKWTPPALSEGQMRLFGPGTKWIYVPMHPTVPEAIISKTATIVRFYRRQNAQEDNRNFLRVETDWFNPEFPLGAFLHKTHVTEIEALREINEWESQQQAERDLYRRYVLGDPSTPKATC